MASFTENVQSLESAISDIEDAVGQWETNRANAAVLSAAHAFRSAISDNPDIGEQYAVIDAFQLLPDTLPEAPVPGPKPLLPESARSSLTAIRAALANPAIRDMLDISDDEAETASKVAKAAEALMPTLSGTKGRKSADLPGSDKRLVADVTLPDGTSKHITGKLSRDDSVRYSVRMAVGDDKDPTFKADFTAAIAEIAQGGQTVIQHANGANVTLSVE